MLKFDGVVKSRHSGENRSPDDLSANALWRTGVYPALDAGPE